MEGSIGEMRQITATVDGDTADAIARAVAGGEYGTEADIVAQALRGWRRGYEARIAELRALIDEGIASGEPLEGGFDLEDIVRRGSERLAQVRSQG